MSVRGIRPPALTLALAAVVVGGCSRCGTSPAAPTERFIPADAGTALVVPSIEGLVRQSSDLLASARSFPFGGALLDARSALAGRLGFDPLDVAAITKAGLDPRRGLAIFAGRTGARGPDQPDVVVSLPVSDRDKLETTLAVMAKERLGATERRVESGAPEVITWRATGGGGIAFAYAFVEETALLAAGNEAVATVRAAAAVPATATLASDASYQRSARVLGEGLAARFHVPAGSPALGRLPQLKDGIALGLGAGRDRITVSAAAPLGAREAPLKAAVAAAASRPMVAKLDPTAVLVARSEGAFAETAGLGSGLAPAGTPPAVAGLLTDLVASFGDGSAAALSVLPPGKRPAPMRAEPLRLFRAEVLVGVRDAPRLTAAIQRTIDALGSGLGGVKLSLGRNPWRLAVGGGEVAAAVKDDRLALTLGPARSLEALLARGGSSFKGPTPASDRALGSGSGGLLLDVPRLAAGVKALPESAWGPGPQGAMLKSMADEWAVAAERIAAISVTTELVDGLARGELLVELVPQPAGAVTR